MKTDRFLILILVFIGLLIIASLVLFFVRQRPQNYVPEDTPQGVIRNYVLALERKDFSRAYALLQEGENKPDLDAFTQAFLSRQLDLSSTALLIQGSEQVGNQAIVSLIVIRAGEGPFDQAYRQADTALLVQNAAGEWKIARLPYPYWGWDWYQKPVPAPGV